MMKPSPSVGIEIADENAQLLQTRGGPVLPTAARWRAAEDRLYPLIMVDPDLYEAAVTLVAEAADVLRRQCRTVSELIDIDNAAVLDKCPSAQGLTALGFDRVTAFDAACAYRWRELTAAQPDAEREASLGAGR